MLRKICSGQHVLPVQLRNDFADSLGSPGRGGDDVLGSSPTVPPCLRTRTIDRLLCGGVRVDGRHQSLDDTELVVDDLGQGRQTVGRAGRVTKMIVGRNNKLK